MVPLSGAEAAGDERTLRFYNIHTKENVTITYKRDGEFLPEGMKEINHIMRDWRRDEPTKMDPKLVDTIWEIYQDVGSEKPIHLVSGYRSRKTNERLRRRGGGQARKSQHILGKAADLHFPDVPVKRLRNSALVREVGGVGYYPKSGLPFVHVDTGRVRHWPRMSRQELAAVFPDGNTKHTPRDGRPLTKRDGAIALAKLDKRIDSFITKKSKIKVPPKMMMAGFTPPKLPWPKSDPVTTASTGKSAAPLPPAPKADMLPRPASAPKPLVIRAPAPQPDMAVTTLDDAEHPEELVYDPSGLEMLINDILVSEDRQMSSLQAPGTEMDEHLLRDPEGAPSEELARSLGYTQRLKLVKFGSDATDFAASAITVGSEKIRTASR